MSDDFSIPEPAAKLFAEARAVALRRIQRNSQLFGARFPSVGQGTQYVLTENQNWLAAFWPGMLWLTYSLNGDTSLRARAESLLPSFQDRLERKIRLNHDLGFLFTLSARAQWQLTGAEVARMLALRAANTLLDRYRDEHEGAAYIQAWGEIGDPVEGGRMIIDCMMNLPLLFWAGWQIGWPEHKSAAFMHARTSQLHLVRPDGSTFHTFFFDQETGKPLGPKTHQGHSDSSLWARGQAWSIYGFTLAAEWMFSGRWAEAFRETAQRCARRFMAELPTNGVPWWDLRLPEDAPHTRDSSASAIAAGGMLRLARLLEEPERGRCRADAVFLMEKVTRYCAEWEPEAQGLLRHGTYNLHDNNGVDAYTVFGDYFYLETLLALAGQAPDFWGPQPGIPWPAVSGSR